MSFANCPTMSYDILFLSVDIKENVKFYQVYNRGNISACENKLLLSLLLLLLLLLLLSVVVVVVVVVVFPNF